MTCKQQIISILREHFAGLQAAYLFGSQADHTGHPDSDVDIAILLSPEQSRQVSQAYLFQVRLELEKISQKNVDLINLRTANTVLQKEVIATGVRIYCSDEYAAELFEMLAFSAYQKLNQERADILQEIFSSSRVLTV